jgi:hypothetical protein
LAENYLTSYTGLDRFSYLGNEELAECDEYTEKWDKKGEIDNGGKVNYSDYRKAIREADRGNRPRISFKRRFEIDYGHLGIKKSLAYGLVKKVGLKPKQFETPPAASIPKSEIGSLVHYMVTIHSSYLSGCASDF